MGEIADGLINGDFDFYTGEYIGRGYGIPRTKNKSLKWEKVSEASKAYRGVHNYVYKTLGFKDCQKIVNDYVPGPGKLKQKCKIIQQDFAAFKKFIKEKYL